MPLPPFGFRHRPSWEFEVPEVGGAALEEPHPRPEPRPQPTSTSWRGRGVIVTGGATGLGRHIALRGEGARLRLRRQVGDVLLTERSLQRAGRVGFNRETKEPGGLRPVRDSRRW